MPPRRLRRALQLLADCPQEGCTEAIMLAHGFTIPQLFELVRFGLATATPQRVKAGGRKMEVATLRAHGGGGGGRSPGERRWSLGWNGYPLIWGNSW
jgi:hypothetical protein